MPSTAHDDLVRRHDAAIRAAADAQVKGRFGLALDLYEEALDHARALGERRRIHAARINISSCYLSLGDYPNARAGLAAIVLESDLPRHVAAAAGQLAEALMKEGRLERASQYLRTAVDAAREAGEPRREAAAMVLQGHLAIHESRNADAETAYLEALARYREVASQPSASAVVDVRASLAAVHDYVGYSRILLGRHAAGLRSLRHGLALARAAQASRVEAEIEKDAAFCLLLADKNLAAERHALRALALAQTHDFPAIMKNTTYILMELSLRSERGHDFDHWFQRLQSQMPDVRLSPDFFRLFDISDVINLKEL